MIRNLVLATLLAVAGVLMGLAIVGLSGAVELASADSGSSAPDLMVLTNDDWGVHMAIEQNQVHVADFKYSFPIEFWAGDCVVRLFNLQNSDTATIRVPNAIPTIVPPNRIIYCTTTN